MAIFRNNEFSFRCDGTIGKLVIVRINGDDFEPKLGLNATDIAMEFCQ